uniref:Putative secreted protein n=1 Tax=Ixodes ricinus TaxID=34613 RepID=A0A6B0TTA6_IXORI
MIRGLFPIFLLLSAVICDCMLPVCCHAVSLSGRGRYDAQAIKMSKPKYFFRFESKPFLKSAIERLHCVIVHSCP